MRPMLRRLKTSGTRRLGSRRCGGSLRCVAGKGATSARAVRGRTLRRMDAPFPPEHPSRATVAAPTAALTVIAGPMFAGKTTELLRRIDAVRRSGERILVAKPARDTRYSEAHLVSHAGARAEAHPLAVVGDLVRLVETAPDGRRPRLVAIDEIHFFAAEAVAPIERLRALGVAVVVAGCDLDHFGEVFAPFDELLPRATEVVRLAGACARCGAPSTHSERLVAATERIIVGGAAEFVATCAACFRPSRR